MKNLFFCILCLTLLIACGDDNKSSGNVDYNPNIPVEVTTFMPDSGRIREKVIIKGSNFGSNKSNVRVFFKDELTERKATVVGVDNNTIYCLAPRQNAGDNYIKVVVNEKDITTSKTFHYTIAENVSTVAGSPAIKGKIDGSLTDARFDYLQGVGALDNESMLVFHRDDPSVRYVSVPDNTVITVQNGFQAGKPAVNKSKTRVYATGQTQPHTIYMYTKDSGWSPSRIGQLGTIVAGEVRALALDDTEQWLYFCDANGKFGRFNIGNQELQILNEKVRDGSSSVSYLIYSPVEDCFYWSAQAAYGIYKISKDGQTVTAFAGFNGNAVLDGYLDECKFAQPNGMTVDEDGNIYVVEGHGGHVIRKISIIDGYVSTIAGIVNKGGNLDGNPKESIFNYPYDIANDGQGNFWIVEGWGMCVRKYAVE